MTVETQSLRFHTRKEGEILDIADKVQSAVENGVIKDGVAFLFVPGSTAEITTIEYDPGLVSDLTEIWIGLCQEMLRMSTTSGGMMETDILT